MSDHIVLVCGGRDYVDRRGVYTCLDGLVPRPTLIITGGANGADSLAADWAGYRDVPKLIFRADWEKHGKAAGPIRNQQMLECKPHLVLAFRGGRGTADMVRRAKATRVPVIEVA
jgi:hypothetical protein